ncbi:Oxygen-dependent choline dehydrogenase [Enhygromyxa salina]|uniref:Oxygen-dependent choline dehydrogenase n=1 Tax=Enhygromyxa salina TaxID=215803 RepID=A0A2S9Y7H9_9BACT|nr:GMC family oxidoreductase [Enhygromyxa salina]PRQ01053.1 Oxygen-dependent choline dehydrogenase [Enhygromyxa salina]
MIGSGPGGAYLAQRLAAGGKSVVLVEVGPVVRTHDFRKEAGSTLARYFFDGGLRRTNGNLFMPTMQARCLGGGSVFNSAICMRTPLFAANKWRSEHGVIGIEPEAMRPHYERVESFMGVREVDPAVQGRRNELFAAGCEAVGATATVISRNEEGCRGSSECFTGCPTRAKKSLDVRGVPEMVEAGGRVYTSVRADTLIMDGKRVRGVEGVAIEPFTGKKGERVRLTARCTILAAGAIASPVIMQRSGIDRAPVGRNLQFHPGTALMGLFPDEVAPWSGATQGYHCLDFMADGIKLESLWVAPSLLAFRFPGIGAGLKDLVSRYNHMASWDVWVSGEDSSGRVRARPGGGHDLRYRIEKPDVQRMQEGIAKLVEMYFAAGATAVYPGVHGLPPEISDAADARIVREADLSPSDFPIASNHVFGSTSMGEDPKRHVVDSSGAAWEVDDLYVCDTGVLPTTPAANPMLTIMAIADRMADTLLTRY